jgi:lysozyme
MRRASAHPLIAPSVAGGPKYPSAHPLISPSPGIFNQLGQTPAAPNLTDVSPSGLGLPHTPGRVDPAMPAKVPFRQGNKLAAVSPQGMEMVKDLEGFSPKAYWDHKQYSVGYGTRAKGADHVVTKTQATKMLKDRMQHNSKLINKMVKVPLNQNQLDALGSFMYNVGSGNFRDSTLLKKLNTGDYTGASKEFEVWNKASGKVHPGLINRRAQEQKLFNTPVSEPQSQLEQTAGQGTQLADLAGQQLGEFAGPIPKHYQDIGSFRSTLKLGETHNTSWNSFQTLKPQFQKQVARVLKDLEKQGYQPLVRNAMRSKAQMLKNFKAGSGARKSIHGLGQGADIVDRRAYKPSMYDRAPKGFWKALNKAARKQGLRSGLYWKKRDRPHIDTGWGVRY